MNKFKKILPGFYIMAVIFSVHAEAEIVTTQQLNISGAVTGGSCTMTLNNSSVNFGNVDMAELSSGGGKAWGSITAKTDSPPTVMLTECSNTLQYTITVSGTPDENDEDAIANQKDATNATGVALETYLTSADNMTVVNEILKPNTASKTLTVSSSDLNNGTGDVLNMGLVLTGPSADATPGGIVINGTVDINYL